MPTSHTDLVITVQLKAGHVNQFVADIAYRDPKDELRLLNPIFGIAGPWEKYANLHAGAYLDPETSDIYGHQIYYQPYQLELHQAETAVKTLRKIHRSLDKVASEQGHAPDFSTFLIRFANILGTASFAEHSSSLRPDGSHWTWMTPDGLRSWVNTHAATCRPGAA